MRGRNASSAPVSDLGAFGRPFDRAVMTLRREFGFNAVIPKVGERFHADYCIALCPLHPTPDVFALELRERGGHGGSLELDCEHGCLPSMLLAELRALEDRQVVRVAAWRAEVAP